MSISLRGIRRMMLKTSSGHFTSESIKYYRQVLEDLTEKVVSDARIFATNAGRRRIDPSDIKLAVNKWIKK